MLKSQRLERIDCRLKILSKQYENNYRKLVKAVDKGNAKMIVKYSKIEHRLTKKQIELQKRLGVFIHAPD